ncbi:ABC transporter ATP-binding protein/permease [Streptomyces sp. NBC_01373]|uniref:ABC transporter ATP-binding protein/permease n=1 Tax=Streptomyces sp. NBC_01373 TaxID=2903843 RepID=UPI0022534FCD|nr:ATP-binding cassette domain-containing protein [Streptomyces sp. NBC_01373]MCX4704551.1 ATP-binding cassette domain-containing protein [Streptomyces sp. NBC_01373]
MTTNKANKANKANERKARDARNETSGPGSAAQRRDDDAWLTACAAPGRRWFGLAGTLQALETMVTITRWGALAWLAQGVLERAVTQETRGLAVFAVASALAVGAGWAADALAERGARAVATDLRRRLTGALLPAAGRTSETGPAEAAWAMVDLADDVADHHAQAAPLHRSAPLSMLAVPAVTAAVHWPAALVLVLTTALLPLNMRLAGLFAQHGADRQLGATRHLNAVVLDSFRGMRTLRELGAAGRRGRTVTTAAERLNKATMSVLRRAFLSGMIMDVVITFSLAVNATYVGLSLLGYVRVPHAPQLTLFRGLLVLLICPVHFAPMRARAAAFHERERATTAARAIRDIVTDTPAGTPRPAARPGLSEPVGVSLAAVRFRYGGADHDTIRADAELDPGTWTALTGPSGSGKSTLLSLIAGLRRPTGGEVRWQTLSVRQPPALGGCAWVGQQTVLLDATVRDNIRLGRPDATERHIRRAVDAAGLDAVIERLPEGLNTRLGEGGWGVSTGEARRIAIARAFLRGARLWLLDEPTAHLDADSERAVVAALRRATEGCTVVVATHSFPLAAAADTVLVIEDGRLHAVGSVNAP